MATLEKTTHDAYVEEFDRLQGTGITAFGEDRLEESIEWFGAALDWARQHDDERRADRAYCNLTTAQVFLGQLDEVGGMTASLRRILMANADEINCRLAAYILGRIYELQKEARKGLFYARIASDRSQLLGRQDWIATSHNQIGNLLTAQSFFEEALAEYQQALELLSDEELGHRAVIWNNMGYCEMMLGRLGKGFELIYRSLRTLRHLGVEKGQAMAHLDLSYAHLEMERYPDAIRHGETGLRMAEQLGERDSIKNGLYLLGEAANQTGDRGAAASYFARLKTEFYPDSPITTDFLMRVNVRKMINLRA